MTADVIYLDYQATTPCDPRVAAAMRPYETEIFANPASRHAPGRAAAQAVDKARDEIAALIGARPGEIVFTSGATEANNLALKGAARQSKARGKHIVTLATEHSSVLEPCRSLASEGFRISELPVMPDGLVDLAVLRAAIGPQTLLVSVAAANSEIGVLQPLAEIGALCRERGALFHCDAAQAFGKIPLDVSRLGIDLMSLSAHKIHGPKGIGALYRRGRPPLPLQPLTEGGGQEWGLRPGTVPVALCVGFGTAAEIAGREMAEEAERLQALRDRLYVLLREQLRCIKLNGHATQRLPHNLNVAFPRVDGMDLIDELPELAVATGSACDSAEQKPSHVLKALGLDDRQASGSLRISLGRFTTAAEINRAAELIIAAVRRLT